MLDSPKEQYKYFNRISELLLMRFLIKLYIIELSAYQEVVILKEVRLCDNGTLSAVSECCRANNMGIEVQSFHNPFLENFDEAFAEHKKVLNSLNCGKSYHAPFWDLNIGTKMKGLRRETMETFNRAYGIAKELGCTEIVVHNGYIPGTYVYSGWVGRAVDFWNEFFRDKDGSIVMCIENQFEEDCEIMKMEIDALKDPRLKICLDVGHANANSNMAPEEWVTCLGDRIAYFHLHNNHGKQKIKGYNNDEHLAVDNGTIDMKRVLNLAEIHCPEAIWNIETASLPDMEESIKFLKENGYL